MAGTAHPGPPTIDPSLGMDVGFEFVGNASGAGIPWDQWDSGGTGGQPNLHDPYQFLAAGGQRTAAGGGGAKPAPAAFTGTDGQEQSSYSADWHERVHVLPRTKIEFGNIITLVEDEYEVYSAFRDQLVTLVSVTNNATPGVVLPNLSTPVDVPKQTSLLDPTSTGNGAGTGLGTLVLLKVQALQDGLPTFDTDILFDFGLPANDVFLLVSGTRIVLVPFDFEVGGGSDLIEALAYLTDVIDAVDGKEQRIALRKNPRQEFAVTYALDGNDRQRMQALIFDWMDNAWGVPLKHEDLFLTAATSPGATQYQVRGADDVDLRVGGLAVVIQDNATFDVLTIAAKTDTLITASDPAVNGYPVGTPIMPLRVARVTRMVEGSRAIANLETLVVEYEVLDNDTGALQGDTTPGFWSIFNGRVLFDDCNVVDGGGMPERYRRRLHVVDNQTGKVTTTSDWDRSKRGSEKGFVLHNRAEIIQFRKVAMALAGRQKAFYVPNFIEDLEPKANLVLGTSTMDIEAIEYTRFVGSRFPMNLFRITFTDGTSLIREVLSSSVVDSTTERLNLDTTWPANRTVAEIHRVEFFDLVRFDADRIQIRYRRSGLAVVTVPVERVFDDN